MSSLAKIAPRRESETERLAREWAVTFAELYRVSLKSRGPRFVDLWVRALSDLEPSALEAACRRTMQVCKFFPTPAEIREHVDRGHKTSAAINDELAWQKILEYCRRFVRPDIVRPAPPCEDEDDETKRIYLAKWGPPLPAAWEFAARVAGGLAFLESCSDRDLIFAKQRFIEALARWRDGAENFAQLPDGATKKLIQGVAAKKQFPTISHAARRAAIGEITAAAPAQFCELTPVVVTNERRALLDRQVAEIRAKASPEQLRRAENLAARH